MDRLDLPPCTVFLDRREVVWPDRTIRLTPTERDLLCHLAEADGASVTTRQLLTEVWGYSEKARSRTPSVTVRRLRTKIEVDPSNPTYLLNVYGSYRLALPEGPAAGPPRGLDALPVHLDGEDRREHIATVQAHEPKLRALLAGDDAVAVRAGLLLGHLGHAVAGYEPPLAEIRALASRVDGVDRHQLLAVVLGNLRRRGARVEGHAEGETLLAGLPDQVWLYSAGDLLLAAEIAHHRLLVCEFQAARDLIARLLPAARRLGLRRDLGKLLHVDAIASQRMGDNATARQRYLDALSHFEALGHLQERARALHDSALLDYDTGDLVSARRKIELSVSILARTGSTRDAAFGRMSLATISLAEGDYDCVIRTTELTIDDARQASDALMEALSNLQRGRAYLGKGDLGEARRHLTRARYVATDRGLHRVASHACRYLGFVALLRREVCAAREAFRAAWRLRQPSDAWAAATLTWWWSKTYATATSRARFERLSARFAEAAGLEPGTITGDLPATPGPTALDTRLAAVLVTAGR